MLAARPEEGDHLLVYQTSTSDASLLDRLREMRRLPEQENFKDWKARQLAAYQTLFGSQARQLLERLGFGTRPGIRMPMASAISSVCVDMKTVPPAAVR